MNAKQVAGYRAAEFVKDGMTIGLGTGSTAYYAIEKIGEMVSGGLQVRAIATSNASEELAKKYNIPLISASEVDHLDLAIDGADEINPQMELIKGGGGALLREKLVAMHSDKFIVIADSSKVVASLGQFKLPIEIVPFTYEWTLKLLRNRYAVPFEMRKNGDDLYVTDNGNYIVDAAFGMIESPATLAEELKAITGVVEHGLFVGITDTVIIGFEDGRTEINEK
ncbi:ribose 5-phosphate isomerase A [Paenibacillus anaericanus]|uniref:ribose-5-phosphate isomerase RpiA n=1 Tax=Paenibacillus anaericanus TaxID=170367 RepID=UPI00277D8562|nr:ribose-5-phosphate isomerase RpiA [Paenibacillus anaericanus]MDQ0086627.1 ribose 5-phosphate isomerase A [Paenibacillus anaericanus]